MGSTLTDIGKLWWRISFQLVSRCYQLCHESEMYLGCSSVLQIGTLASATRRALMPRLVRILAQKRQVKVNALREESSSWCGEEEVVE